jgi:hypothetical protein
VVSSSVSSWLLGPRSLHPSRPSVRGPSVRPPSVRPPSVRRPPPQEFPLSDSAPFSQFVDVWWIKNDGGLLLLITHLLSKHRLWRGCKLRLHLITESGTDPELIKGRMSRLLTLVNIDASVQEVILVEPESLLPYMVTSGARLRNQQINAADAKSAAADGATGGAGSSQLDELLVAPAPHDDEHMELAAVVAPNHIRRRSAVALPAGGVGPPALSRAPSVFDLRTAEGVAAWAGAATPAEGKGEGGGEASGTLSQLLLRRSPSASALDRLTPGSLVRGRHGKLRSSLEGVGGSDDDGAAGQLSPTKVAPLAPPSPPPPSSPPPSPTPPARFASLPPPLSPAPAPAQQRSPHQPAIRVNGLLAVEQPLSSKVRKHSGLFSRFSLGLAPAEPPSAAALTDELQSSERLREFISRNALDADKAAELRAIFEASAAEAREQASAQPPPVAYKWDEIHRIIMSRSQHSSLVVLNLPDPPDVARVDGAYAEADMARMFEYAEYIESLAHGLTRVLFVHGAGQEIIHLSN